MRFYAVSTAAIDHTHRALSRLHHERRGGHGPSRALRVAQLYGHLQCRADADGELLLTLQDLARSWHLQPSQLRTDLRDLQSLGWLQVQRRGNGTHIRLIDHDATTPRSEARTTAAPTGPQPDLLTVFVEEYNRHRPPSWPAYAPRSSGLASRLTRAIRHAGGAEAFWPLLRRALGAMPPFWRDTYPNGRSGGDCVAALLSTDRQGAGLGVEFWHVFRWASAATTGATSTSAAVAMPDQATASDPLLATARSLFLWDGHHWRGQGSAALHLDRRERLRLTLALEAAGVGQPGAALAQFGPADA